MLLYLKGSFIFPRRNLQVWCFSRATTAELSHLFCKAKVGSWPLTFTSSLCGYRVTVSLESLFYPRKIWNGKFASLRICFSLFFPPVAQSSVPALGQGYHPGLTPIPTDSYRFLQIAFRFLQKTVKGETSRRCSRWPVLNLGMTTVRGRIEANAAQCMGLLQAGSCQRAKAKLILNWWCWGLDIDKNPRGVSGISAMLKAETWRGVWIKTISGHKNS